MRIIAGKYSGFKLNFIKNKNIRIVKDNVKEAIFNMINFDFKKNGYVLDLYAGSGSLSIEAISRGMYFSVCIDNNPKAINIIYKNVNLINKLNNFLIKLYDSNKILKFLKKKKILFDLIFLDPPYNKKNNVIQQIKKMLKYKILNKNSIIVCKVYKNFELPNNINYKINIYKKAIYGIDKIYIYKY